MEGGEISWWQHNRELPASQHSTVLQLTTRTGLDTLTGHITGGAFRLSVNQSRQHGPGLTRASFRMEQAIEDDLNGNLAAGKLFSLTSLAKSDSRSCDSESESEPYHDCDNCDTDDDQEDHQVDGVDFEEPDDRDSLEFEYEPGISLSSLQFYQTCECQNDSETGEQNVK